MDGTENGERSPRDFKSDVLDLDGDMEIGVPTGPSRNEEKTFKAHSSFMVMASPVFERMMEQKHNFEVNKFSIPDCFAETMEHFLKYVYKGTPRMNEDYDVWSLYYIAEKYLMDNLKEFCLKHIKQYRNYELFTNYEMSIFFQMQDDYFKNYIVNNLRLGLKSEDFVRMHPETFLMILQQPALNADESFLYLAACQYVKNLMKDEYEEFDENQTNFDQSDSLMLKSLPRTEFVDNILSNIFFKEMSAQEFLRIGEMGFLTQQESFAILSNLNGRDLPRGVDERIPWPRGFRWCKRIEKDRNVASESFVLKLPCENHVYYAEEAQSCKFTVNEPIYLNGIEVSNMVTPPRGKHQYSRSVIPFYVDAVTIKVTDEAWKEVYLFYPKGTALYFSEYQIIMFDRRVKLESNKVYRIEVMFTKVGARYCLGNTNRVYSEGTTSFNFMTPEEESHFPVKSLRFCREYDYTF